MKYHDLQTIIKNARIFGGNKEPQLEPLDAEAEREKLLAPLKQSQQLEQAYGKQSKSNSPSVEG